MGGFHQLRVMQRLLYKHHDCKGYKTWCVDSGTMAGGSANQAFEEGHYYRSMRLHKECFDASNEMIKNSPKIIIDLLFNFINTYLEKALIPKSWCLDLINPIHKEGNKDNPNNYRGLCISFALLKIICSLLNNRI